jgi:hypothetical protein
MTTNEQTATVSPEQKRDLEIAMGAMNPLEFAKHLHSLHLPDEVKSEWLLRKVNESPAEREEIMKRAIDKTMAEFWDRLAEEAK